MAITETNQMVLDKQDLFKEKIFVVPNPGGHWIWGGDSRDDGYGYFEMNHDNEHTRINAHRASYIIFKDPTLDEDMVIIHTCDLRACVNPAHLAEGSQHANMTDMAQKGRSADGEDSGQAKMTEEQVLDLRRRYSAGEGLRDLAKEFGIAPSTASYIVNLKTWQGGPDAKTP